MVKMTKKKKIILCIGIIGISVMLLYILLHYCFYLISQNNPFNEKYEEYKQVYLEVTQPIEGAEEPAGGVKQLNNERTRKGIDTLKEIAFEAERLAKTEREKDIVESMFKYISEIEEYLTFTQEWSKMETRDKQDCDFYFTWIHMRREGITTGDYF